MVSKNFGLLVVSLYIFISLSNAWSFPKSKLSEEEHDIDMFEEMQTRLREAVASDKNKANVKSEQDLSIDPWKPFNFQTQLTPQFNSFEASHVWPQITLFDIQAQMYQMNLLYMEELFKQQLAQAYAFQPYAHIMFSHPLKQQFPYPYDYIPASMPSAQFPFNNNIPFMENKLQKESTGIPETSTKHLTQFIEEEGKLIEEPKVLEQTTQQSILLKPTKEEQNGLTHHGLRRFGPHFQSKLNVVTTTVKSAVKMIVPTTTMTKSMQIESDFNKGNDKEIIAKKLSFNQRKAESDVKKLQHLPNQARIAKNSQKISNLNQQQDIY